MLDMRKTASLWAAYGMASVLACGARVVVDAPPGSLGGLGGTTEGSGAAAGAPYWSSTAPSNGGGGPLTDADAGPAAPESCLNPPGANTVTYLGATGGDPCSYRFSDTAGYDFEATCSGSSCQLTVSGPQGSEFPCSCTLDEALDICSGAPICFSWLQKR